MSPSSGAVFERICIEQYIAVNGRDPITKLPLSADQLIKLNLPTVQTQQVPPNDSNNASDVLSEAVFTCNSLLYQTISNQEHATTARARHHQIMRTNLCTFQMLKQMKRRIQLAIRERRLKRPTKLKSVGIQCNFHKNRKRE